MFPGEKSPGLIEAQLRPDHKTGIGQFPGEKSPGLIEATMDCMYRRIANMAMFPGEKSPGLIEARNQVTLHSQSQRFRGRNPPASLKLGVEGVTVKRTPYVSGGEIPRPH